MNYRDNPIYWALMFLCLSSLLFAIRSGLDSRVQLSRTRRIIRVVGGSLWAAMIILGMIVYAWEKLGR